MSIFCIASAMVLSGAAPSATVAILDVTAASLTSARADTTAGSGTGSVLLSPNPVEFTARVGVGTFREVNIQNNGTETIVLPDFVQVLRGTPFSSFGTGNSCSNLVMPRGSPNCIEDIDYDPHVIGRDVATVQVPTGTPGEFRTLTLQGTATAAQASAPRFVSGIEGNRSVALSWGPPTSSGGLDIDHYLVIPSIGSVAQAAITTPTASSTFTVAGLTNGVPYTFSLIAVTSYGNGVVSAPSAVQVPYALTYAVASPSSVSRHLTLAELHAAYTCQLGGIAPQLPASGKVRSRWEALVGVADIDVQDGAYPCIHDHLMGEPIGDSEGRMLADDSIAPFSIDDYLAQGSLVRPDRRGLAVLGSIEGAAPITSASVLAYAVTNTSSVARSLTLQNLKDAYTCQLAGIKPLLPDVGSSLRASWESLIGLVDADVTAGAYPCIVTTRDAQAIPQNDGRFLDDSSIVPYLSSAFASQTNLLSADVHGRAVLGRIDGSSPIVTNSGFSY